MLAFLAERLTESGRELEGAIHRLRASYAGNQFDREGRYAAIQCGQERCGFIECAQESDHDRVFFEMCKIVGARSIHDREHVGIRE